MRGFKKTIDTTRVMRKQLYRSPIYISLLAGGLLFALFALYRATGNKEPLGTLFHSDYLIIAITLLMYVFGLAIADMGDYDLDTLPGGGGALIAAKGMLSLELSAALSLGVLLEIYALYIATGVSSAVLYGYAAKYALMYFFFPFLICALLGATIGLCVPGRWRYLLILIAWLFTSPLATEAISLTMNLTGASLGFPLYFFSVFSLGKMMTLDTADLYGVSFESALWALLLLKFAFAALGCFAMLLCGRRKLRRAVAAGLGVVIVAVIACTYTEESLAFTFYSGHANTLSATMEMDYYSQPWEDIVPDYRREVNLKPVSCDIRMNMGSRLSVRCDTDYTVLSECGEQSFTLYRSLKVRGVSVNGAPAEFERKGDYILVRFPETLKSGAEVRIGFEFAGRTSPLLPSNDYQLSLISAYSWHPRLGMVTPRQEDEEAHFAGLGLAALYAPLETKEPVEYTVTIENREYGVLFCNLERIDGHTWRGESSVGVTMLAHALMAQKTVDGIETYYPITGEYALEFMVRRSILMYRYASLMSPHWESMDISKFAVYPVRYSTVMPGMALVTRIDKNTIGTMYNSSMSLNTAAQFPMENFIFDDAFESITDSTDFYLSYDREKLNKLILGMYIDYQIENGRIEGKKSSHFAREEAEYLTDWLYKEDAEGLARTKECYTLTLEWMEKATDDQIETLFADWYERCVAGTESADVFIDAVKEALQ